MAGAVAAGMWLFAPSPEPPPLIQSPVPAHRIVTVHVSGAVAAPGLVSVDGGARVADAIAAAGGALPAADLGRLNLAAPISDGQQLVVPAASGGTMAGEPAADGRVRINVADATTLEALPGVGPVLAQRIVAHRQANGPFAVVEDLLDVPGIGEGKLASLRDSVLVP